jgi:hypothetical protein
LLWCRSRFILRGKEVVMNRYCVVTREISGWLGDNPPGEVVEAEYVTFNDSGVACFVDSRNKLVRAFAPGAWREVVRLEEETK